MQKDVAPERLRTGQTAVEVARGGGQDRAAIRSDLGDRLARQREDSPVRVALDVRDRFDEATHHVTVGPGEQRQREAIAGRHEAGGDRLVLERHADELGLDAHLNHEVRRHQVHLVAVATPDEVEAGGERPQDPAAVPVELVAPSCSSSGVPGGLIRRCCQMSCRW
jgi:hypothetical protein